MRSRKFEFYPPEPPAILWHCDPRKPLCNDPLTATAIAVSVIGTAAATTTQVIQTRNAAKQAELNAEAEAQALNREAQRQQIEFEENQRRLARQQKAFRSSQLARIAESGFLTGTGTALDLEADTWAQQQRELADQQYVQSVQQQSLQYKAGTALELGRQQSSMLRSQTLGTVAGGVGSIAGTLALIPRSNKPITPTAAPTTAPKPVSARPPGLVASK